MDNETVSGFSRGACASVRLSSSVLQRLQIVPTDTQNRVGTEGVTEIAESRRGSAILDGRADRRYACGRLGAEV